MARTATITEKKLVYRIILFSWMKPPTIFLVLTIDDPKAMDDLPAHPVMKKWWAYIEDIMENECK